MPSKYLNDARTGELIQKIYTADRAIATECKGYTDTEITTTITALIDAKCAQAKLDAHPVGSFYESTDSTSPATLFGGTWQEQIPDGELIGTVAAFSSSSLPTGWLLCDGSAVSRTTYAALFTAIGTTYGSGDGSTTFALPNLTNRFIQGSSTAGTAKAAGLPNITGGTSSAICVVKFDKTAVATTSGALGVGASYRSTVAQDASSERGFQTLNFDASRSSSIYGNSSTVQPPALTMQYAIYTGVTSNHKWVRQS